MSFDPETIYQAIKKHVPQFEMIYDIDPLKQRIADSWPDSLDAVSYTHLFNENISVAKELFGEHVRLFTMLDTTYIDRQIRRDAKE